MLDIEIVVTAISSFASKIENVALTEAVEAALAAARNGPLAPPVGAVSAGIRITDDEEMQALNREYRGVDATTDVLSFSFVTEHDGPNVATPADWPVHLGEIVISAPYAQRQATELGHSFETELAWLTIHGTLQLIGYEHAEEQDAIQMEALELSALRTLGLAVE